MDIGTGILNPIVTKQGNTFNGASQLVKLDATGKLPTVDGSNVTNVSTTPHQFLQLQGVI